MTLEEDLRLTLRDRAGQTPAPQPDLLAAVRAGVRRGNRRRVAWAAAAVVATVVAVPVALAGHHASRPSPPAVPSVSPSPVPARWDRPQVRMPTFPLTPGWTPAGIGPGTIGLLGPNTYLDYEGSGVLSAEVGPVPGAWENEGDENHRATVGGRPATVRTATGYDGASPGDRYVGVRWRLPDGDWVQVLSFGPRTEADVLRFARGLRPQTMPPTRAPFAFAAMPPGLTLQHVADHYLCFAPQAAGNDRNGHGLCVGVEADTPENQLDPDDEQLTIGGRPATISEVELKVHLAGERMLTVSVDQEMVALGRADMIRFAEGITVTG